VGCPCAAGQRLPPHGRAHAPRCRPAAGQAVGRPSAGRPVDPARPGRGGDQDQRPIPGSIASTSQSSCSRSSQTSRRGWASCGWRQCGGRRSCTQGGGPGSRQRRRSGRSQRRQVGGHRMGAAAGCFRTWAGSASRPLAGAVLGGGVLVLRTGHQWMATYSPNRVRAFRSRSTSAGPVSSVRPRSIARFSASARAGSGRCPSSTAWCVRGSGPG
jgi:hypothetical protein